MVVFLLELVESLETVSMLKRKDRPPTKRLTTAKIRLRRTLRGRACHPPTATETTDSKSDAIEQHALLAQAILPSCANSSDSTSDSLGLAQHPRSQTSAKTAVMDFLELIRLQIPTAILHGVGPARDAYEKIKRDAIYGAED